MPFNRENKIRKEYIYVLRRPDGSEYEQAVPAVCEEDAERRLKIMLDVFNSPDKVITLKEIITPGFSAT